MATWFAIGCTAFRKIWVKYASNQVIVILKSKQLNFGIKLFMQSPLFETIFAGNKTIEKDIEFPFPLFAEVFACKGAS